jgi:hypothetical protein
MNFMDFMVLIGSKTHANKASLGCLVAIIIVALSLVCILSSLLEH